MTNMPQRIWAEDPDIFDGVGFWRQDPHPKETEYIRADLVPQWQPIETAPKDDTAIMAYCQPCREFPNGRMMMWRASILQTAIDGGPRHLQFPATHWMPLPKPPS